MINKQEKLNSLINFFIEKNGGVEDKGFYQYIIEALRNCELMLDYPTGFARDQNRDLIVYTFKTDNKDAIELLNNEKKVIISAIYDLMEDNYELVTDEDGDGTIDIKYVHQVSKLLKPVKHSFIQCEGMILQSINEAKYNIYAAVAWITNQRIMDALITKANEGVDIILLVDKGNEQSDRKNYEFIKKQQILPFPVIPCENMNSNFGNDFRNTMHHKFCVIDNSVVLHGTYNWTIKAEYNDEDITLDKNEQSAIDFLNRFKELKIKYNVRVGFDYSRRFW